MQEVNFNSIKVRLEPNNTDATVNAVVVFQFHKGTIRTSRAAAYTTASTFQFHKGTIRTRLTPSS